LDSDEYEKLAKKTNARISAVAAGFKLLALILGLIAAGYLCFLADAYYTVAVLDWMDR